jgi:hypothetical protein
MSLNNRSQLKVNHNYITVCLQQKYVKLKHNHTKQLQSFVPMMSAGNAQKMIHTECVCMFIIYF